jgi:hypothetical protein
MEHGPFTNNYLPGNKKMLVRFSLVFSIGLATAERFVKEGGLRFYYRASASGAGRGGLAHREERNGRSGRCLEAR